MTSGWTAAQLGDAMRRIGWLAIFALLGLEVDGRPLLRAPLALAIAVAAWSLGGAAPGAPIRRQLRAATAAAVVVAVASVAPWLDVDREGMAMVAGIASLAGGAAYSRAMGAWVIGPGIERVTRRFRLAARVQGWVAAAMATYALVVVVVGSSATADAADGRFQAGGAQYDLSVLFGRSIEPGAASIVAEVVLVAVLLVGVVGLYLMATANQWAQRALRGGQIIDAPGTPPGEAVVS